MLVAVIDTAAISTGFELAEGAPVPAALIALTVQVYVTPAVRPVTTIGLAAPLVITAAPPLTGAHVTLYAVTRLPPSLAGGVNDTIA